MSQQIHSQEIRVTQTPLANQYLLISNNECNSDINALKAF